MPAPFTLVTTVFNEARRLNDTIADIEAQLLKPDEVIVIDAGSTDGTMERLARWAKESTIAIRAEVMPRCTIAEGRNYAISIARNELIASTDFGCRYKPSWLLNLMKPFDDPSIEVSAGNFTVVESEINTLAAKADFVLQNEYEYNEAWPYLPSSRSIGYYRYVWEKAGKYPEWVTLAADDSTFWYIIEKMGFKQHIHWDRDVYWMRHNSFTGFEKEAYRYGLGEGETRTGLRNFYSRLIETTLCHSILPLLILTVVLAFIGWEFWYLLLPLNLISLFGLRSHVRAYKQWSKLTNPKYNTWEVFFGCLKMIEICRWNHMKGYIVGYWDSKESVKEEGKKLQAYLAS